MNRIFHIIYRLFIISAAVLAALLMGALILKIIGAPVLRTYRVIIFEPLNGIFNMTEVLVRMIPLLTIALGIAVAYRSGIINIGAEGQMAFGILGTSLVALAFPAVPKPVLLPLALFAGTAAGGLWGFIPGILKAKLQVSELLSTVMLNYIAEQFYSFCLRVPLLDPAEMTNGSGTPQTMRLTKNVWLDRLVPRTSLHAGIFIALALALLMYLLLWKTACGYRMRASGASARAARYGGINVPKNLVTAMVISGALAGLAGGMEVCGVHHRAIEGITGGYGFSAIVVALFGGLHPAGIIPASFFFGMLLYGANLPQSMGIDVPANMVDVLQGIIILVIVSTQVILSNTYLEARVYRRLFVAKEKIA
jgi:general nucleoside transport system permease protein